MIYWARRRLIVFVLVCPCNYTLWSQLFPSFPAVLYCSFFCDSAPMSSALVRAERGKYSFPTTVSRIVIEPACTTLAVVTPTWQLLPCVTHIRSAERMEHIVKCLVSVSQRHLACLETQVTSIGPVHCFHVVQVLGSDATFVMI